MCTHLSYQPTPELVQFLRSLARTTESPSEILVWLKANVASKEMFVDYLLFVFGDESDMWTIATRWWRGEYPGTRADTILRHTLTQTEGFWNKP